MEQYNSDNWFKILLLCHTILPFGIRKKMTLYSIRVLFMIYRINIIDQMICGREGP